MTLGPIEAVRLFTFDLARAVAFYEGALGLQKVFQQDGVAMFETGQAKLLVELAERNDPEQRALVGRFAGLSFTVADAGAAHAELAGKGVRFEAPPQSQDWGGVLAHFADPDGNLLTLVQYP